ncbi:hypothetical protein [Kocuria sp. NPDC057446]|uniref:hypothetical protein n=1 Tax=Kocuria sp. NPDC057446 TaxID=3346137 RepID=UPI00368682FA
MGEPCQQGGTREVIEAHPTIVFTTLALSRTVQARIGLATRNLILQLRPLRSATIAINGTAQTLAPDIPHRTAVHPRRHPWVRNLARSE